MSVDLINNQQPQMGASGVDTHKAQERNLDTEMGQLSTQLKAIYAQIANQYANASIPLWVVMQELESRDPSSLAFFNELISINNNVQRPANSSYYDLTLPAYGTLKIPKRLSEDMALPLDVLTAVISPGIVKIGKDINHARLIAQTQEFEATNYKETRKKLDKSTEFLAKIAYVSELRINEYIDDINVISRYAENLNQNLDPRAGEIGSTIDAVSNYIFKASDLLSKIAALDGLAISKAGERQPSANIQNEKDEEANVGDYKISLDSPIGDIFLILESLPAGVEIPSFNLLYNKIIDVLDLASSTTEAAPITGSNNSIILHDMEKKWKISENLTVFILPIDGKYMPPFPDMVVLNEDRISLIQMTLLEYIREILGTIAYFTLLLKTVSGLQPSKKEFERGFSHYQEQYVNESEHVHYLSADGFVPVRTATLNALEAVEEIKETYRQSIIASQGDFSEEMLSDYPLCVQRIDVEDVTITEPIPTVEDGAESGNFVIDIYNGPVADNSYQVIKVTNFTSQSDAIKFIETLKQYKSEVDDVVYGSGKPNRNPKGGLRLAGLSLSELGDASLTVKLTSEIKVNDIDANPVVGLDGNPVVRVEVFIRYPVEKQSQSLAA